MPVDPGVADRHALSVSLREIDVGLQHPIGFDRVYRLPGFDDHFVRASGGLYAVFPQSIYAQTRFGDVPLIPAGTVFHIGDPTLSLYGPQPDSPGLGVDLTRYGRPLSYRIESRVEAAEDGLRRPPPLVHLPDAFARSAMRSEQAIDSAEPIDAPGTIIGDEQYRRERMHMLLEQAAEAERHGTQPNDGPD
jgi:hypothetical protein